MNKQIALLLLRIRNLIWDIRIAKKGDAFEHASGLYECGVTNKSLIELQELLEANDYAINEVAQYEVVGQKLSGHQYYDFDMKGIPHRQHHIRVVRNEEGSGYKILSHDEYCWFSHPIGHIRAATISNDCEHTKRIIPI